MKHIISIVLCACLLWACGTVQKITKEIGSGIQDISESISGSTSSLLQDTGTKGVKSFTLSNFGRKELSADDKKQLNALAKEIKALGNCQVTVFGHTDNTGSSAVNASVSAQRARLVTDYLKGKGVANVSGKGLSYNHPVAGNDTDAGRAKNRRVEVFVSTAGKYNPYE